MSSRRSGSSQGGSMPPPKAFGAAFSSMRSNHQSDDDEIIEPPNYAFSYMKPTNETTELEGPWNWTTATSPISNTFDDHLEIAPDLKARFTDARHIMLEDCQKKSVFEENNASFLGLGTSGTILSVVGDQKVSLKRFHDKRTELRDRHGNYVDGKDRGRMKKRYELEWSKRIQDREDEMLRANDIWIEWQSLSDEQKTERRAQASRDRIAVLQSLEIDEEEAIPETYDHRDIWRDVSYFNARRALQPISVPPSTAPLTEESSVGDLFLTDDDSVIGPPADAQSSISNLFAESSVSNPYAQSSVANSYSHYQPDTDSDGRIAPSYEREVEIAGSQTKIPKTGLKLGQLRSNQRSRRRQYQSSGKSSLPSAYGRRDDETILGSRRSEISSRDEDQEEPTKNVKVWHQRQRIVSFPKQPTSQAPSQIPTSVHKFTTWPDILPPEDIDMLEVPDVEYINDQAQLDHVTEISTTQARLVTVELVDANIEYSSAKILDRVFGGSLQEVQFFPRARQAVLLFLHPTDAAAFVRHVECAAKHSAHEYRRLQLGCAWYKGPMNSAIWPAQEGILTSAIVESCSRVLLIEKIGDGDGDTKDALLAKFKTLFLEQHIVKAKLVAPKKNYEKERERPNAVILEFASIKQAMAAKSTLTALPSHSPFAEFLDCPVSYLPDSVSKPATRMPWCSCSHCKSPPRSSDVGGYAGVGGRGRGAGDEDSQVSYDTVLSGSAFIRAAKTLRVGDFDYETQHDARVPQGWERRFASHVVKSGNLEAMDEEEWLEEW